MELLGHLVSQKLIRKNHSRAYPGLMVFFDTETSAAQEKDIEIHRMKIAWACRVERRPIDRRATQDWVFFNRSFPFCRWLESLPREKKPLWLFSHNIFFDLQAMDFFVYFTNWGWELDFVYENQLSYILVVKKDRRVIKCISTTNYFDTSLQEIGDLVGLSKSEVDFTAATDDELSAYCRRDVEILKLAMERYFEFIQSHDLGRFGMTKAAQAFNAFRHRFMSNRIYVHREEPAIDLEEQAYIGGRTECFQLGQVKGGPFVTLDINSMYPYVMKTESFPCRLSAYHDHYDLDRLEKDLCNFDALAEVSIETESPRYAVQGENKVIFPVGRFTAFLCSGGLRLGLACGEIRAVKRIAFYESAPLFKDYVDYFHELRKRYKKEGNRTYEEMVKKFLNSLYGKFGQWRPVADWERCETGEPYYCVDTYDCVTHEKTKEYKLMNRLVTESGKELGLNSFLAIAAHITEYARILLDGIMEETGRERVLYCDTDSIKIRKSDLRHVFHPRHPDRLGALKAEGETKELKILGPKSYITDQGVKLKGVPKRAVEMSPNLYGYLSFPRQATHLRERHISGFYAQYAWRYVSQYYDKGTVSRDGSVSPFRLAEY